MALPSTPFLQSDKFNSVIHGHPLARPIMEEEDRGQLERNSDFNFFKHDRYFCTAILSLKQPDRSRYSMSWQCLDSAAKPITLPLLPVSECVFVCVSE